jgi:hypothetical protein
MRKQKFDLLKEKKDKRTYPIIAYHTIFIEQIHKFVLKQEAEAFLANFENDINTAAHETFRIYGEQYILNISYFLDGMPTITHKILNIESCLYNIFQGYSLDTGRYAYRLITTAINECIILNNHLFKYADEKRLTTDKPKILFFKDRLSKQLDILDKYKAPD